MSRQLQVYGARGLRSYGAPGYGSYKVAKWAAKYLGKRIGRYSWKSDASGGSKKQKAGPKPKNVAGRPRSGGGMDGRIRRLERTVIDDISTRTFRKRAYSRLAAIVNVKPLLEFTGIIVTDLEAALTGVRFWDSSVAPGSFTTGDLKGPESQQCQIASLDSKITIRNNGVVDCYLELYLIVPKVDGSITGIAAYESGMGDQQGATHTAVNSFLTDSEQFKALWKIVQSKKILLIAGRETSLSYHFGSFAYNPSIFDDHSDTYQRKLGGHSYVIRLSGVVSHIVGTPTTLGSGACSVDMYRDQKIVVKYDSGGPTLRDIHLEDNGAAGVTHSTNKAASAQQTFA